MKKTTKEITKPRLIVFDLDHTLFNFFTDEIDPIWAFDPKTTVEQLSTRWPLYPEIMQVLEKIKSMQIPIAIASMAKQIKWGEQLVEKFGLKEFIHLGDEVIVVGRKDGNKYEHFNQIMQAFNRTYSKIESNNNFSPIRYDEIVFFDDYDHNHKCLGKLGVHGFLCNARGVTMENLDWMMSKFQDNTSRDIEYPYNIVWDEMYDEKSKKYDRDCIYQNPPKAYLRNSCDE